MPCFSVGAACGRPMGIIRGEAPYTKNGRAGWYLKSYRLQQHDPRGGADIQAVLVPQGRLYLADVGLASHLTFGQMGPLFLNPQAK